MKCPSCGRENPESAVRCTQCRARLDDYADDRTMDAPASSASHGETLPSRTESSIKAPSMVRTPSGHSPSQSRSSTSSGARSRVLEPGDELGPRFLIDDLLGEGGMGRVYKATDRELGRVIAIKVLLSELTADAQVIQRFKHELLLASRISHRNILRIHDLSEADGVKFITMAYVEGKDLNQVLKTESPLPLERCLKFARQLCEALAAAHAEGVVHRDFKPHNVLVGKDDQVYVSDFGLATSFETAKMGMTRSGAFVGTPKYMSPEQVEGGTVDQRSDLYSLGLVIYEMATGEVPFAGESTWQVMYQRVKEKPKDPKLVKPDLPDWVARIIMHCLEKDPANRYQTANEILADMDTHRSPSSHSQTVVLPITPKAAKWTGSAIGAVIVLGILFFAFPTTRQLVFWSDGTATSGGGERPGLPPLSAGKYVAVLPFRVLGGDDSLGYVADGLGEALTAKLFQLNDVRITSTNAAQKTNDRQTPLPQIAKDLGVNLIVHGLVQGSGKQLRIVVKLENMETNQLQWSQEFSGMGGDLLTLEDQIYSKLVDALKVKATAGEMSVAGTHPTENVAAYDIYLRGRQSLRGQQDPKNIQTAIDLFEQAIKMDNGFALAYTGLSDASMLMYREKKDRFWSERGIAAAKQAERLNGKLPEVHFSLGSAYSSTGQTTEAIAELRKALELAPNSDEAYRRLGNAYADVGQKDQAIQALRKASDLNPYYWVNQNALGTAYFEFGDYEKALKQFESVTQLEPDNAAGYDNMGSVYSRMGKYQDSIGAYQKALQIQPYAGTYSNLATAFFYLKRYPEAVERFEKAVEMNPGDETYAGNLADAYRWAGQKDKANATYDKAIALAYKQLQVNPRDANTMGHLALYYAKKGDAAQAKEFIKRARTIDPSDVYSLYISAVVDTIANDPKSAIVSLRAALQKGFSVGDIESEPEFAPLRLAPEYQAMIKEFSQKSH
jgi:serine/threonine protein kinase/tetratricopeptide (TPR) repeat protein/TolB-like protein